MKKELIVQLRKSFEESAYEEQGVEYWLARDLQKLLDYEEWRNFVNVIEKAKISCKNSGQNISDHFVDINKTILSWTNIECRGFFHTKCGKILCE